MTALSFRFRRAAALAVLSILPLAGTLRADDAADLRQLQSQVDQLQQKVAAMDSPQPSTSPGRLRLIDSSVDVLLAAGGSTASEHELEHLQGGGHDPKRDGFTLQQAELSFSGAVDPFFKGELHVVLLEDAIELEEAFLTSTALPGGLQLKAGYFLTEFGRVNPTHPHSWYWLDQPVIAGRLLGADGLRGAGLRLGWLAPTPWYAQLLFGIQNADNASMISFLGEGHQHGEDEHSHADDEEEAEEAGHEHEHELDIEETIAGQPRMGREINGLDDYLYHARWENSGDVTEQLSALLGFSALYGPNASGENGETFIYGADLLLKWRPASAKRGYPFVAWQTEFMKRDFKTDTAEVPHGDHVHTFDAVTIEDWGLYSQILVGLSPRWETGVRVDYATGSDDGAEERDHDAARSDRIRISPLIAYRPSEFSRVRLQYNYDDADFLEDGDAHTLWAGLEVLFGSHPAHAY